MIWEWYQQSSTSFTEITNIDNDANIDNDGFNLWHDDNSTEG